MAAAGALGAALFFRLSVASGFDRVMGISSDTRLMVFIHEHWWSVLRGHHSWLSPPFFHPERQTLGYTDTFFLNALSYVPLRAAGVEPFLAFQLTVVVSSLIGFVAAYLVFTWVVGAGRRVSLALAWVVAFASSLFNQAAHPQLFFVHWLPVVALLAWCAWTMPGRRGAVAAVAAGLVGGLVTYSGFYVAWFTILATGVGVAVASVTVVAWGRARHVVAFVRQHRSRLALAAGGFAVAMVPFAMTYGPVLRQNRDRSLDVAMAFTQPPSNLLNVGQDNLVWGWAMPTNEGGYFGQELIVGFAPIFLLAALAAMVLFVRVAMAGDRSGRLVVGIGLAAAFATLVLLPMRFGSWSLWRWAWEVIPGATAVRVPSRAWVVAVPVGCLLVAAAWTAARLPVWRSRAHLVVLAVLSLLVLEQIGTDTYWEVHRHDERAALASVPAPLPACRSFFVVGPTWTDAPDGASVDAMMIAMAVGLPTINGYSGLRPLGFDPRPADPNYAESLSAWLTGVGEADGVCAYHHATRSWRDVDPLAPLG